MADYSNHVKTYKLMFSTGVASPVFTGKKIRGDQSETIDVILVDSRTNNIVNVGPSASKRVRVVLLPASFGGVLKSLEFKNNIIIDWKNKKNILLGDLSFDLKHGRGSVGNIWIKHDRHHLSKSLFRLGAMIVDGSVEIKEAISDPFEVKDHRIELNNKNRRVALEDNVSRLKNIGKKGALCKRLQNEKILTVKDFLDRLSSNPTSLQKIYGSKGKRWEVTVDHAKTSISGKKAENVYGSIVSTSQVWDDESLFDQNGCSEFDVESLAPSPSYDQFPPINNLEHGDEDFNMESWSIEQDFEHDNFCSFVENFEYVDEIFNMNLWSLE